MSEYLRVCRRPFVAGLNGCTIAKWKGHSHFCTEMIDNTFAFTVYVCGFSAVARRDFCGIAVLVRFWIRF